MMANLTRIKNNQITDNTIVASTKIVPGTITGGLLSNTFSYTGDFSVTGNLTISGTTTTVDTTNTTAADPLIVLNKNTTGTNTYDMGLILERGTSTNTAMIWDEANDQFAMILTTEVGTTAGSINNSGYADLKVGNLALTGALSGVTSGTFGNINIASNAITSTNTNGAIVLDPNGTGAVNLAANTNVTGSLDVSANIANANVVFANVFTSNIATGTAPFTVSSTTQVANLNVAVAGSLVNGTSNVAIPTLNGNVEIGVAGNANVLVITGTGANISGTANITGNANVGNLGAATVVASTAVNTPLVQNGNSNVAITANGNIALTATSNTTVVVTDLGANITGYANISGNANVGNLGTAGTVIASTLESNVTTGTAPLTVASTTQVANLNVATAGNLVNGNSNVLVAANSNVTVSVAGNANILTVTGTGANIAGTANVTGNLDAGNVSTNVAVITTGNITTINSGLLQNGNSNVAITANGNIALTATSNTTVTITDLGANIAGYANISGNANIGNVGTTNIEMTANLSGANVVFANTFTSNVTTGAPLTINSNSQVANLNAEFAGTLINGTSNVDIPSANGNIELSVGGNANVMVVTGTGANITGYANVSGTANVGNLNVVGDSNLGANGNVIITGGSNGQVLSTDGAGNLSWLTIATNALTNGNSNVVVAANGNVSVSVAGNSNVVVITDTGANVNGYLTVTGNLDANNLTVTNNLYVNGSDIDTDSATFNIANANATTLNIGGAATTVNIGATTGNTIIKNDLQINGNDIRSSTGNVAISLNDIDVTIAGNLTVQGTRTEVGTQDLVVSDSLINLHTQPNLAPLTVDDGRDIGLVFHYYKTSDKQAFLGWANDTGALEYYSEGIESNTGTFSGQYGTIKANLFLSEVATGTAPFTVKSTTQVANLNVAAAGSLINGTSNVAIPTLNGNVEIGVGGNANVLVVSASGANITGTANVSGNANVGNLDTAAIVMTANLSGANVVFSNTFTSNVTTGTAPFTVSSTTQVANLNVAVAGNLVNGNSNVLVYANSDIAVSSAGNSNVFLVTGVGANVAGTLNVTGNANVGNIGGATIVATTAFDGPLFQNGNSNVAITANGNVTIASAGNAAIITVTGTGANISGTANISGNANVGNLGTAGTVIASTLESNVTTGTAPLTVISTTQVANLNVASAGNLVNGNSNVVVNANSNVTVSVAGNANIVTVTGTGANISGYANITGNLDAGNVSTNIAVITTGNITTINSGLLQNGTTNVALAASGNVGVSVAGNTNVFVVSGTGANISGTANVTGNLDAGNVSTNIAVITTGNITTINSGLMQNGNSNVAITANGNISLTATSNTTVVVTDLGANITGYANISGNANIGNVGTGTIIATTGNITTINSGLMQNGNSNVAIAANGDVTISSAGNANILTVNGTTVIANGDVTTASTTANLFNANATTLNIGGAATALNLGATSGTTTVKNDLLANANLTVTGFADIGNILIANNNITTINSNGNLELDANGTGSIVLNNAADNTNVIINGNNTSGYSNLLVAKASSGQIGILTNNPTAGTALDVNANTAVKLATGTTGERPAGVTGMIRYNTTDNGFEYYDGAQWTSMAATFTIVSADSFTGDGSTLAYTLSQSATTASTIVSINGIIQIPTTAYTVSGTTLTFTEAPLSTDIIDARVVTTTTEVTALKQGDSNISVSDTGSNGTITFTTDGVVRGTVTTTFNVNTAVVSNLAATNVGAATVVIDSFPVATYRSAKYLISVSNSGRGDYETQEVVVVHNGTTAYRSAYGIVESNVSLGTTSVAISGGNVELSYTGNFAGNAVKIYKTYIPV